LAVTAQLTATVDPEHRHDGGLEHGDRQDHHALADDQQARTRGRHSDRAGLPDAGFAHVHSVP
jgi:hypothetical protein